VFVSTAAGYRIERDMSISVKNTMPVDEYLKLHGRKKPNKYRNTPTTRLAGSRVISFDSQKEAARYDELMMMHINGDIADLRLQPQFILQGSYTTPEGERIRSITYIADFLYITKGKSPRLIVEDVKTKATRTPEYQLKKKLMADRLGIQVVEI